VAHTALRRFLHFERLRIFSANRASRQRKHNLIYAACVVSRIRNYTPQIGSQHLDIAYMNGHSCLRTLWLTTKGSTFRMAFGCAQFLRIAYLERRANLG
jgi:hypothetical protein